MGERVDWELGANSKRVDVHDWVHCAPRCASCGAPLAVSYSGLRYEYAWPYCPASLDECKYGRSQHTFVKLH